MNSIHHSPNALKSEPIESEWTAAKASGLHIIPVFTHPEYIPPLLKPLLGCLFDPFDIEKNLEAGRRLLLETVLSSLSLTILEKGLWAQTTFEAAWS